MIFKKMTIYRKMTNEEVKILSLRFILIWSTKLFLYANCANGSNIAVCISWLSKHQDKWSKGVREKKTGGKEKDRRSKTVTAVQSSTMCSLNFIDVYFRFVDLCDCVSVCECECVSFYYYSSLKRRCESKKTTKIFWDKRKNKIASSVIVVELYTLISVTIFMRYKIFIQSLPRMFCSSNGYDVIASSSFV